MITLSACLLLPSFLLTPVWSALLAQSPVPTVPGDNDQDALIQGWTPKPTTPPSLPKYGSISPAELFARQDDGVQRTCGYLTGPGAQSLTCGPSHSCTYITQQAFTPGNFGCCLISSGRQGCGYVSTCIDYTDGGPGPTGQGVYFAVQDQRIYCGSNYPHCTGVQLYGNSDSNAPSNSFANKSVASWTCGLGSATIATAYLTTPFPTSTPSSNSSSSSTSASASVGAASASSSSTTVTSSTATPTTSPGGLSSGAEIGIGVGVGLAVAGALVGLVIWLILRRRGSKGGEVSTTEQHPDTPSGYQAYQQQQQQQQPLVGSWYEANKQHDGNGAPWHAAAHEAAPQEPPSELPATPRLHELGQREVGEMPGTQEQK